MRERKVRLGVNMRIGPFSARRPLLPHSETFAIGPDGLEGTC